MDWKGAVSDMKSERIALFTHLARLERPLREHFARLSNTEFGTELLQVEDKGAKGLGVTVRRDVALGEPLLFAPEPLVSAVTSPVDPDRVRQLFPSLADRPDLSGDHVSSLKQTLFCDQCSMYLGDRDDYVYCQLCHDDWTRSPPLLNMSSVEGIRSVHQFEVCDADYYCPVYCSETCRAVAAAAPGDVDTVAGHHRMLCLGLAEAAKDSDRKQALVNLLVLYRCLPKQTAFRMFVIKALTLGVDLIPWLSTTDAGNFRFVSSVRLSEHKDAGTGADGVQESLSDANYDFAVSVLSAEDTRLRLGRMAVSILHVLPGLSISQVISAIIACARNGQSFVPLGSEAHSYGLYDTQFLVNHSCEPNSLMDGTMLVASKDISAGEEVTISYVDPLLNAADRRQILWYRYSIKCPKTCTKCYPKAA